MNSSRPPDFRAKEIGTSVPQEQAEVFLDHSVKQGTMIEGDPQQRAVFQLVLPRVKQDFELELIIPQSFLIRPQNIEEYVTHSYALRIFQATMGDMCSDLSTRSRHRGGRQI